VAAGTSIPTASGTVAGIATAPAGAETAPGAGSPRP
jgi:hypothetical protein